MAEGADRCPQCGASQLTGTCPHCRAIAGISAHDELRYVCDVCGGPRVPEPAGIKLHGKELAPLRAAHAARRSRTAYRIGAIAAGASLPFFFVLLLLIELIFTGFPFLLAVALTCLPLAALSAWALSRANARGKQIPIALDAAWLAASAEVARQSAQPLTAAALASSLRIEEPRAEELLALLEAHDLVRGDLTAGGEMAYASRMRIEPAAVAATTPQAEAEAEREADAAAETADPTRAKR